MLAKKLLQFMRLLLLVGLILSLAAPGGVRAAPAAPIAGEQPPARPVPTPSIMKRAAADCGAPTRVMAGQDLEALLVGPANKVMQVSQQYDYVFRLDMGAPYSTTAGATALVIPAFNDSANFTAAVRDNMRIAMAWQQRSNHATLGNHIMVQMMENSQWGVAYDAGMPTEETLVGKLELLAPDPSQLVLFSRTDYSTIVYKTYLQESGFIPDWSTIPMTSTAVVSDPKAVVIGSRHVGLFFIGYEGGRRSVYFDEAFGTNWRTGPINLGVPVSGQDVNDDISAFALRNDHIVVFVTVTGASGSKALYMKEWAIDKNLADWSDTQWVRVVSSFTDRYNVTSRHATHMAVAYQASANSVKVKEWSHINGWQQDAAALDLGAPNSTASIGHISLLSLFTNEMALLVKRGETFSIKSWNSKSGWDAWKPAINASQMKEPFLALVSNPHNYLIIAPYVQNYPAAMTYASQTSKIITTPLTNNKSTGADSPFQKVIQVNGKAYWFNAYLYNAKWFVEARDMKTWNGVVQQLAHADSGQGAYLTTAAITAGDMDRDGDDEVLVTTLKADGSRMDISAIELAVDPNSSASPPALVITPQMVSINAPANDRFGANIRVALGEMDGLPGDTTVTPDGLNNEIFVGVLPRGKTAARLYYFQYLNGVLTPAMLGGASYVDISTTISNRAIDGFQMAVGHFSYGSSDALAINLQSGFNTELKYYTLFTQAGGIRRTRLLAGPVPSANAYYTPGVMAAADIDSDTLDEVVLVQPAPIPGTVKLYVLDAEALPEKMEDAPIQVALKFGSVTATQPQQIAIGDLDQDGGLEIIVKSATIPTTEYALFLTRFDGKKLLTNIRAYRGLQKTSTLLIGDIDNDSQSAVIENCEDYTGAVSVQGVVYTPPIYYNGALPLQNFGAEFAQGSSYGRNEEKGFTVSLGGSLGVGVDVEFLAPILAFKIGGFKLMSTAEIIGSVGRSLSQSREIYYEQTRAIEGGPNNADGISAGLVLFSSTNYRCINYRIYEADNHDISYPMKVCLPPSRVQNTYATVEDWYNVFKPQMGDFWVPLVSGGQVATDTPPTNNMADLVKYGVRSSPHVDGNLVEFELPQGISVPRSSDSNASSGWSTDSVTGNSKTVKGNLDFSQTLSSEVTFGGAVLAASITAGFGREWATTQSWSEKISYGASIGAAPIASVCAGCRPYTVRPYVAIATGKTPQGVMYRYMVQDYYVSSFDAYRPALEAALAPQAVNEAPLAPMVVSNTHPDQDMWYNNNDVFFMWFPGAGDPQMLAGYRYILTPNPTEIPTYSLTEPGGENNGFWAYDLPDGVRYLHVQAQGLDGSVSPTTHYQVKIDVEAPEATITLTPEAPDGLNGWYQTFPVTATLSGEDSGSGVAFLEYRIDGGEWMPYTTPLVFTSATPGVLIEGRAHDFAGHQSAAAAATVRIDNVAPTLTDVDGKGLSYTALKTGDNGNAILSLGGVIEDALSGANNVLIKSGENGLWHDVDEMGRFDMPADNTLPSSQTFLNWIYRPSFDVRGVYPLINYGIDQAGIASTPSVIGTFSWQPQAQPVFNESMVSASPAAAAPGSTVLFTLAARNSGMQESLVVVTDTLPVNVTALPDSITEGGVYLPAERQIVWHLKGLWPGETRYLRFEAVPDVSLPAGGLYNQMEVMGYWEWMEGDGIPAEPEHVRFTTGNTLTILGGAAKRWLSEAPVVNGMLVVEGQLLFDPNLTLLISASPSAQSLMIKEWIWDDLAEQWQTVQLSPWQPFTDPELNLSQDESGQYLSAPYHLTPHDGVHYLGVWVKDAAGQVSNLNEGNLVFTNLLQPAIKTLPAGQHVQYRLLLNENEEVGLDLISVHGDADLYMWGPRSAFYPDGYSNGTATVERLAYTTPEAGMTIVEVYAESEAEFMLIATAGGVTAGFSKAALPYLNLGDDAEAALAQLAQRGAAAGLHAAADEKEMPAHPITLTTPFSLPDILTLVRTLFAPIVCK